MNLDVLNDTWTLDLAAWRACERELCARSRKLKAARAQPGGNPEAQSQLDGHVRPRLTALYVLRALARGRQHLAADVAQGRWLRARRWHVEQLPDVCVRAAATNVLAPGADQVAGERITS